MNTLHVEPAKTETSPGEFVLDGFRVVPVTEGERGDAIYQSRFANKAIFKAAVLLGSAKYSGWAVTVSGEEVTDVAGKLNLEQIVDADRFRMIREIARQEVPVDMAIAVMKSAPAPGEDTGATEGDSSSE